MSFAHLRQGDYDYVLLEQMLLDERQRYDALATLTAYLLMWPPDQWIDEEKIYYLGVDISRICPSHFRQTVMDTVREKVPRLVADIFIAGFERPASEQVNFESPPANTELTALTSRLEKNISSGMEGDIEALIRRYVAFTENWGDPQFLEDALIQICTVLVRVRGPMRPWAADLARRLAQEGLKWASESHRLWALWGRSLAKAGAFEAAELVYWETLRRFPWNPYVRHQLILVVKRQPNRFNEAISLARESFQLFPNSGAIAVQLALLLGYSRDGNNISTAIDILSKRIKETHEVRYEITPLASVLVAAGRKNLLSDGDLRLVVNRLRNKQRLLGAITHILINQHRAFTVAQRLLRCRIADVRSNAIAWSQLAEAYAASGTEADLTEGKKILRNARIEFPNDLGIRNHLAKLLAATGRRDEAIALLRDAMTIDDHNVYARNHLAELLASSGDPRDHEEAIRLLHETKQMGDEYAAKLLAVVLQTPQGTPIPAQTAAEQPIEIDEDEELSLVEELSIEPTQVVPADVAKWGTTRRLRFNLDNGSAEEKRAALEQVSEVLHNDPTFAYAKLLAVRQGIWLDQADAMTDFAFAFERALRDHDESQLELLLRNFPRFEAITIVAKAMFGDEQSAAKIANLMSVDDEALHPAVRALKRRMRPQLKLIKGGQSPARVVEENASEILVALYDANESALYEKLPRAA